MLSCSRVGALRITDTDVTDRVEEKMSTFSNLLAAMRDTVSMDNSDSDGEVSNEDTDVSGLTPETQRVAKKANERTRAYQIQARRTRGKVKQAQKKVACAQQELQVQQQAHVQQVERAAIAQSNLATNMLALGVPLAKVAATISLPILDVRSRLLQEIRATDAADILKAPYKKDALEDKHGE